MQRELTRWIDKFNVWLHVDWFISTWHSRWIEIELKIAINVERIEFVAVDLLMLRSCSSWSVRNSMAHDTRTDPVLWLPVCDDTQIKLWWFAGE